ncbi:MAG: hypothetical protein ACQEXJ_11585 [Myxococcota bacterium]
MRDISGILGAAALAVLLVTAGLGAPAAEAAPIRFGFTGVHALPDSVWSDMEPAARAAFIEHRAETAATLGASVLRLGDVEPLLATWEEVDGGEAHRSWARMDAAVGALSGHGLEVCLTVPDLPAGGTSAADQDFVASLAERYDGDVDFGVAAADRNYEFPNIDGSDLITEDDWEADEADLQAWADAHRVALVEPGDEPMRLERTGQLGEGAYGSLVKAARAGLDDAGSDQRLMLAGVAIEEQSKAHFTERLAALSTGEGPWFDVANVHLFESTGDLTQAEPVALVRKLGDWLEAVGHQDAERWIGEVAFGSSPQEAGAGPCTDPRCSERTQASSLVRLVVSAAADGVPVMLYAEPIETVGPGVAEGPRTGTGLLTMELQGNLDPSMLPLSPRPAWAVWRRLGDLLGGVDTADVTPLAGLPVNAHGFRVGDAGWIAWYDWTRAVPPGEPWDGAQAQVVLDGLEAPSVRVVSLWPEDVGDTIDEDGRAEASWAEEAAPVEDGEATVLVGRDPVWIEAADQVITPVDGAADVAQDIAGGDVPVEADSRAGGGGGGGCGAGGASPGWPLSLLAGVLLDVAVVRRRRRRPEAPAR